MKVLKAWRYQPSGSRAGGVKARKPAGGYSTKKSRYGMRPSSSACA
jgi:hypothetical protein